jgi:hypothetical protein
MEFTSSQFGRHRLEGPTAKPVGEHGSHEVDHKPTDPQTNEENHQLFKPPNSCIHRISADNSTEDGECREAQ